MSGSPPRVWGQLPRPNLGRMTIRFTPTCVGTTDGAREREGQRTVHPHVCGDNMFRRGRGLGRFGSPPRVWGQHAHSWHKDRR